MLGVVLVVLGVVWLLVQCGLGLPPLAEAMTLDPVVDSDRYWQFVFLGPALPVALGVFLLRYRIQGFAQLKRERINCAAHLLVSAGIALVLGKLCVLAQA
ncbi:hypothetical protein [Pseudomonas nitroreducens]|uniref:hypothetical protein n=1 Tax=Pseudomonas nitroreducens TaxID=46680 RepID=UPI003D2E9657